MDDSWITGVGYLNCDDCGARYIDFYNVEQRVCPKCFIVRMDAKIALED